MTGFGAHHNEPENDPELLRVELDAAREELARVRRVCSAAIIETAEQTSALHAEIERLRGEVVRWAALVDADGALNEIERLRHCYRLALDALRECECPHPRQEGPR